MNPVCCASCFFAPQIGQVLRCFGMGEDAVRAAALLFCRAADLEENIDAMTGAMQVGAGWVAVIQLAVLRGGRRMCWW